MSMIDRTSSKPYYEQLYVVLLGQIRGGRITAQDRLPSENELHREFGLSRGTVRQALELLEANGWAVRVPRRGYFASAPPIEHAWHIEGAGGFLEDELGYGAGSIRTTVVHADRVQLPRHAALALQIDGPANGFILQRRRMLNRQLVLFSTNYSPPATAQLVSAAADVVSGAASLSQALREGGFVAHGCHRVLHALPAPNPVADQLTIAEGSPLLRIRSVTWGADQTPFDYYETWLRSDCVPLELSISAQHPAPVAPA